jgi:hypothetical protein
VIHSRHYIREDAVIIKLSVYLDWVILLFFLNGY